MFIALRFLHYDYTDVSAFELFLKYFQLIEMNNRRTAHIQGVQKVLYISCDMYMYVKKLLFFNFFLLI